MTYEKWERRSDVGSQELRVKWQLTGELQTWSWLHALILWTGLLRAKPCASEEPRTLVIRTFI